ncbi:hypothetical protein AC579_5054 [Pseudocercospora musae]|uniref:Uncharacterized protein n=1 Tax=Pseudocercospora musae TaxID=113226 RepID=A0A139I7W6_9PEZI|nr:hypothetical protein AC579_5054 [Pseudocercospora musae]
MLSRAVSPTPSPSNSAHNSQDFGRPRRSVASYRLFPTVVPTPTPTPPSSPGRVTVPRNTHTHTHTHTLSRASAGSSRRRSSSVDRHAPSRQSLLASASASASGQTTQPTQPTQPARGGVRKGSLPELPPLHSARDGDVHVSRPPSRRALTSASDVRAQADENALIFRPRESFESNAKLASSGLNQQHAAAPRASSALHRQRQRQPQPHMARPKPNLRIAIANIEKDESQPPSPPPKSPRHWNDEKSPKTHSHSPVSPTTASSYLGPPLAPRPRTASEQSLNMRHLASTTLQAPASKFSAFPTISTPTTSMNGPVPSSTTRTSSLPPNTSLPSVSANEPTPSSRYQTCNDSVPLTAKQDQRPAATNQEQTSSPSIADVIRQHAASQAQASGPSRSKDTARDLHKPEAADSTPRRSTNAALAAVAAARARVAALQSADSTAASAAESDSPMKRAPHAAQAAVAAARASVAALQSIEFPLASPRIVTYGVSPGSESGSISRSLMTEVLSPRPSAPSQTDPLETLKSISEQCEALHGRYASLRVERQKASTSITTTLKNQKPGPEYCNTLLDEQLSLAAISSSMDICIAKLKSLECRREDAIAAVIAQATQNKASPADNIAAMIASMAISRKASVAPSADSGSRFMPTGRSTPDISVDGFSANRSTCSSFPRTVSYTSEADSYDYRLSGLSGQPSLGCDLAQRSEAADDHSSDDSLKIGESPPADRRTPLHEPSEALEQLQEEIDSVSEQPTRVVSPLSRESSLDQLSQMDSISRPSSSDTSTTDELFEQPKRIRVDGVKAARILGMLSEGGQKSPLIKLPDQFGNASSEQQRETEVEIELYSSSYRPRARAADAPTTSSFKDLEGPPESPFSRNDDLDSPSLQDLDVQLGNFPKPAPSPPKDNSRSLPTPPPKYSITHSEQQQMRKRRHDSSVDCRPQLQQNCSVGSNTKRPLSQKSAHTIQVYLDEEDQDDLLELYKLRSAATAVS